MGDVVSDFRFGMVGHGMIAGRFAEAIRVVDGAEVVAVSGRNRARAEAFADAHGIPAAYGSAGEMLAAGGLDAVYVCTPHPAHADAAVACLEAGVGVLVEKPLAPTQAQVQRILAASIAGGAFVMEAMWTRFLPVYEIVRRWLDDGRIGQVTKLSASFGFRVPVDPTHRLFDPALAGGSLLDVGVYPLGLARWLFVAPPEQVAAVGVVGDTGVDEHVAISARYPTGGLAQLGCAVVAELDPVAVITGTAGTIEIPDFWGAERATLRTAGEEIVEEVPHRGNGFEYQIEEVMDCVRSGVLESHRMPHAHSLEMAELCDRLRRDLQVSYPFE